MKNYPFLCLFLLLSVFVFGRSAPDQDPEDPEGAAGCVTVAFEHPWYVGGGASAVDRRLSQRIVDFGGSGDEYDTRRFGVAVRLLHRLEKRWYWSADVAWSIRADRSPFFHTFVADTASFHGNFAFLDAGVGVGLIHTVAPDLEAYVGGGGSVAVLSLMAEMWDQALVSVSPALRGEVGIYLTVADSLILTVGATTSVTRYPWERVFVAPETFGRVSLLIGVGAAY